MTEPETRGVVRAHGPLGEGAEMKRFLSFLARAVQRFHTYPSNSPLCEEAVAETHAALVALPDRGPLALHVNPEALYLEERPLEAGRLVASDLVRRLYRANVCELVIDRDASRRDLARFCEELARQDRAVGLEDTLADALAAHGVEKVHVVLAERTEVLDLGIPDAERLEVVREERSRREAVGEEGSYGYLYRPGGGWVRVDPACDLEPVALQDLALLVEDPVALAEMLDRLGEGKEAAAGSEALEQKFTALTRLFSSLEPSAAERMFRGLAAALLELEPARRQRLLQRTVLPGLMDGKVDAGVLKHFPDVELADALNLLLDLEFGSPEMVDVALERLALDEERKANLLPLLRRSVEPEGAPRVNGEAPETILEQLASGGMTGYEDGRILVQAEQGKDFRHFAALDFAVDAGTEARLAEIAGRIEGTIEVSERLRCALNLVRLEPNPERVRAFLGASEGLLDRLARGGAWAEVAAWIGRLRRWRDEVAAERSEVATLVGEFLQDFFSARVLVELLRLLGEETADGTAVAGGLVEAFGPATVDPCLARLQEEESRTERRLLLDFLCDHAASLAPALPGRLADPDWRVVRNVVRILGFAGAGYEDLVAEQLRHPQERVIREAFQALARIASPEAAEIVAGELESQDRTTRELAEEALWHLPPAEARRQTRKLLSRRDFVLANPGLSRRLLERSVANGTEGFGGILRALQPFRFRIWRPGLARLGFTARRCLRQGGS